MALVMVLNDGETFTALDGCAVISVPDDYDGEVDAAIEAAYHGDDGEGCELHYKYIEERGKAVRDYGFGGGATPKVI